MAVDQRHVPRNPQNTIKCTHRADPPQDDFTIAGANTGDVSAYAQNSRVLYDIRTDVVSSRAHDRASLLTCRARAAHAAELTSC
jgi:hypothetical protein